MKTKLCAVIFLLAVAMAQAQTNNLSALLQQALFEEQANQNLPAAISNYQSLAAQYDKDRSLAATAVFRLGECYRMQGKTNEAAAQYERVLHDFSEQKTLSTLSRQNLTGMGFTSQERFQQRLEPIVSRFPPDSTTLPTDFEEQEIRRIQQMIQNSPDLINSPGVEDETPLVRAASNGWSEVAAYLLDHGAEVNAGWPPALCASASAGNRAMVELLLSRSANVNSKGFNQETPLLIAVVKKYPSVVEVLLANKADVNIPNASQITPLDLAAGTGQAKMVQRLLEAGAKPNLQDNTGRGALHYAIDAASPEFVKLLLAAGADVNSEDTFGRAPLSYAAERNDPLIVKLLLDAKADPNGGKLNAPIFEAIKLGNTNTLELLLHAGANPNRQGTIDWQIDFANSMYQQRVSVTPLFLAAYMNQQPLLQLLLKSKADPNVSTWEGHSLVYWFLGKPEVVSALLDAGADAEASESFRPGDRFRPGLSQTVTETLLQIAASQNQPETVAVLLRHGADPNARDERGDTVLHYAAFNLSDEKVFARLLDHNADPNVRNNNGETPLDAIKERQQFQMSDVRFGNHPGQSISPEQVKLAGELANLLRQHGALDRLPDWDRITVSRPSANFSQMVFQKGTNNWNQFTLLETILNCYQPHAPTPPAGSFQARLRQISDGSAGSYSGNLKFPDLAKIKIIRHSRNSTNETRIQVNLLNSTNGINCSKDIQLEFGDVVEISERDHALGDVAVGLTGAQIDSIADYLKGSVQLVTHDQRIELPIYPSLDAARIGFVLQQPEAQKVLLSSSDLSRVKITRHDAKTGKNHEWIIDCRSAVVSGNGYNVPDLWLRDGDVIEVPEKS